MKNYKNPGWMEELKDQWDEKTGGLCIHLLKENTITDHPRQEI